MKQLLFVLLALPLITVAQTDEKIGKNLPGWYINAAGDKTDGLIKIEQMTEMAANDNPLKFTRTTDENIEHINKGELKAFLVNKKLYTPIEIEGMSTWVVNSTQGAIKIIGVPEHTESREKTVYEKVPDPGSEHGYKIVAHFEDTDAYWSEVLKIQKLDQILPYPLFRKEMAAIVEDYEELATKITNKEKGYKKSLLSTNYEEAMFRHYNKWYDENNPDVITYYPTVATFVAPAGTATSAYEKEVIAAAEEAHRAPRIDVFKGRPATAGAAVASAKPEVTVKKESFMERLNRIKTDGNKVGVLVTCGNLVINPGTFSEGITKARVLGSYGPLKGLDVLAKTTSDRLNSGFGVDVFEAVDYSQIPVKEGKYGKIDDWWATKYKVIVMYELEPSYIAYYKTISGTTEREFKAQMKVSGEMIVMSAEEAKPEKLKYVTSSPKNWGYYRSEMYVASADTDFNIIQELKSAINPPSDEVVIEAIIKSQKEYLDKFVKKKSK